MKNIVFLLLFFQICFAQNKFEVFVKKEKSYKYNIIKNESELKIIFDFGALSENESPIIDFYIQNLKDTMLLEYVGWGEPMFAPKFENLPILPNSTRKIQYKCVYCKNRYGAFNKTAIIKTNLGYIYVTFKGNIEYKK